MDKLKIEDICNFLKSEVNNEGKEVVISGISTDTRTLKKGDAFVALIGKNFDGHNYIKTAEEKGAACLIVSKKVKSSCPAILVEDTLEALKQIAQNYRQRFNIPLIAVTGSVGKTSTKEMIASVLCQKYNVHKTDKNFNNDIGLPLTLMNIENKHNISVVEMGMSNFGEIENLTNIARPDIGVITNIGTAHIENLGSRDGIFKAKMEITKLFNKENILIINGDNEYLSRIKGTNYKVIKVCIDNDGDYKAYDIVDLGIDGINFKCLYRSKELNLRINVPGVHNIYNALVAIALGDIYNLSSEQLIKGISEFKPGKLRMDIIELDKDIRIINDCYNANPESMKAAINVLQSFSNGRKIAILGDMLELGDFSEEAHKEIGEYLRQKCDLFISIGDASGFINEGIDNCLENYHFKNIDDAKGFLQNLLRANDTILIKGSRGMKMEKVTELLLETGRREN